MVISRINSIDFLKVAAMFAIVLGHIRPLNLLSGLGYATADYEIFLLSSLGYLGAFGNAIFIICSAYFLVDNKKISVEKIIHIVADNWILSFLSLVLLIYLRVLPSYKFAIMSLLPVSYGINWFVGCYILYYLSCPYVNIVLTNLSKKEHMRLAVFLMFLYFLLYFLLPKASFYWNYYVGFIVIHISIGYSKNYMVNFMGDMEKNKKLLCLCLATLWSVILGTNLVGLTLCVWGVNLMYFSYFNNVLFFLSSFAIFNIFRHKDIGNNSLIWKLSQSTLLIFIIHESLFVRLYFKPMLFRKYMSYLGTENILAFSLIFGILVFIASALLSFIYLTFFANYIHKISDSIYSFFKRRFVRLDEIIACID